MKLHWLNNNSDKLILFITGWGMDEKPTIFLNNGKYDVLTIYDYKSNQNEKPDISKYKQTYLVSWSLGVWAASVYLKDVEYEFEKKIAINGTPVPIDPKMGIPPQIFELTLKSWSLAAREKFFNKMFTNSFEREKFYKTLPNRDIHNQKEELNWCFQNQNKYSPKYINWDYSYIGLKDKIFPPFNMLTYWKNTEAFIYKTPYSHFPFYAWNSWSDLINNFN